MPIPVFRICIPILLLTTTSPILSLDNLNLAYGLIRMCSFSFLQSKLCNMLFWRVLRLVAIDSIPSIYSYVAGNRVYIVLWSIYVITDTIPWDMLTPRKRSYIQNCRWNATMFSHINASRCCPSWYGLPFQRLRKREERDIIASNSYIWLLATISHSFRFRSLKWETSWWIHLGFYS